MRIGFTLALLLSLTTLSRADDPKPIQLFNGKDLSNWTWIPAKPGVKIEDVFTVKDGVIHCAGKPGGYIRTNDDYTSFVLKVQWRTIKKGNSGVLIRCQQPDKIWPKSIECQLLTDNSGDIWDVDNYPIKVDPARTDGRHTKKLKPSNEKPLGEWNQYEITMNGTNLELKVNGEVQNTATDVEVLPGKILLQSEGAEIEFQNIELTPIEEKAQKAAAQPPLDSDIQKLIDPGATATVAPSKGLNIDPPPPPANKSQNVTFTKIGSGTVVLTGNNTTTAPASPIKGWHPIGSGKWTMEDGVIVGRKSKAEKDYGHLVSDDSYGDFTAKFKFKSVEGNSGFYYHSEVQGIELHGIQCEIDPEHHVGGIYESYGRNWVIPAPTDEELKTFFKPQDWNEMTVECKGKHIKVAINGHTTVDYEDEKGKTEGHFALQMHGGTTVDGLIMFKELEINGDKK